jgi:phosphoribosyl 1,2-cyclic phosphodiesterase
MLVNILASGSEGNATLVRTSKLNILIDAGMTAKYLDRELQKNELTLRNIDYIIITHTHTDHVSALAVIIKYHRPKIIMTAKMFASLKYLEDYEHVIILVDDLELEDVLIESIKTSHDTTDSRGYILTKAASSLVYITDTGYLNKKYFKKLYNKTVYIFESNHDVEMLMHGKYPHWLKRRVGGDEGHLSNDSSSFYLSKIIGPDTKQIILAHLSEENNSSEIALAGIRSYFNKRGIDFQNITTASQKEQSEVIEV